MVNQLGKFSQNLAQLTQPLRELLSKKNIWKWGPAQDSAFLAVKDELSRPQVLAQYNPSAETKISADASSFALGAVLLQRSQSSWKPVAFASRTMTDTEQRYAQIEKEALAATWACKNFSNYVLGMKLTLETDHKPLVLSPSSWLACPYVRCDSDLAWTDMTIQFSMFLKSTLYG